MSEHSSRAERRRDAGMSLPEVLISVVLSSMLIVALSSAVLVMVQTQDNTEGRLNNARSEQTVGLWMPADLASAYGYDDDADASPCGSSCPPTANVGGSNAIMVWWTNSVAGASSAVTTTTYVSYRYLQDTDGEWQLVRVECTTSGGGYDCNSIVVLHDLDGPPDHISWSPGSTVPDWVIAVSDPLDPRDPGNTGSTLPSEEGLPDKDARRLVVTINGGGDAPGKGGGTNQITLSAGNADLDTIDATSLAGTPSFTAARSRCGGYITLVVDESTSIGSTAMTQVRAAVTQFVEAFAGTPVKLQIIGFSTKSRTLGTSDWTRYFDMLVESEVSSLLSAVSGLTSSGYTNWEDALFRTFYNSNGTVQSILPDMVLFFTDGVPTRSRVTQNSSSAGTDPPARLVGYPAETTTEFNQESFYRANYIAQQFRSSVRLIGVGVGPDVDPSKTANKSDWVTVNGWHYFYERAFHYEKRANAYSSWTTTDLAGYNAASATNRRLRYTSPWNVWEPTDKAGYDAASSSGRRRTKTYSEPFDTFDQTTTATYNATIIRRLITGTDNGVDGLLSGGSYTNAAEANIFILPQWSQFSDALQAVALSECGATLTLQTKVAGAAAADPFTYQNTAITSSGGSPLATDLSVVTTTRQFTSGTFDFDIADGSFVTVEIQPQNLSSLTAYQPSSWTCRAGPSTKSFESVPIAGTTWTGIRLQVAANEAVSCVQNVTRTS